MILRRRLACATLLVLATALGQASVDTPSAVASAKQCREKSDASACTRAIRLGLSPKLASETYTFWADTFPNHSGYDEPIKLLRQAVKLDPKNALAAYLLATYLSRSSFKEVEEKERLLRTASELRPDWDAPLLELAALAAPWNYEEMIRDWSKAAKLQPDDSEYEAQLQAAKQGQEAGLALIRDREQKAKADSRLWSGSVVEAAKWVCDIPTAEEYAARVNDSWPSTRWRLLAETYEGCGRYEQARELYRKIIGDFEKRLDSGLTEQEVIQVHEGSLQFLDLLPELFRFDLLDATLSERRGGWQVAGVMVERAAAIAPSADVFARLAQDRLRAHTDWNNGKLVNDYDVVEAVKKGLKLDPKLLERFPDLKPYAPREPKK